MVPCFTKSFSLVKSLDLNDIRLYLTTFFTVLPSGVSVVTFSCFAFMGVENALGGKALGGSCERLSTSSDKSPNPTFINISMLNIPMPIGDESSSMSDCGDCDLVERGDDFMEPGENAFITASKFCLC